MKQKTKLVATIMSMCLIVCVAVIGILAAKKLELKVGGNINFMADGVSFTVTPGAFYRTDKTTPYANITTQENILQGFSMDTNTKLESVQDDIASWDDLELVLDSQGDAVLKLNLKNDMTDKDLYVLFAVDPGENLNQNMNIVAPTSEKLAAGASKDVYITFDILDHSINASLEGFEIKLVFSEPVMISDSGEVQNHENLNYKYIQYDLDSATNTASICYADPELSGELLLVDRVYTSTKEYSVTKIDTFVFSDIETITSVILPSTLKTIGASAFTFCTAIKSLVIPDSVTVIEEDAFSDCFQLEHIVLSKNIKRLELHTFGTAAISSIYIPEGVEFIGTGVFTGCQNLSSVTLPSTIKQMSDQCFTASNSSDGEYFEYLVVKAPTPPSFVKSESTARPLEGDFPIYVPAGSVEAYKSAIFWSLIADRIFPIA